MTMGDRYACQGPWEFGGRSGLACLLCDSFFHSEEGRALSLGDGNLGFTPKFCN